MTEELPPENPETNPEPTPEPVDPFLDHTKRITVERIVSHMNGVGSTIVQQYPMAEVQSWDIQKEEAEALLALTDPTAAEVAETAPFLLKVAEAHHGPAEDTERVSQVVTKAQAVKTNADMWAALAAFVNGLRARASDRIEAASTVDEVFTIESETQTELSAFREANGV